MTIETEIKNELNSLKRQVEVLSEQYQKLENLFRDHTHKGSDGSKKILTDTEITLNNLSLVGGIPTEMKETGTIVKAPFNIYENLKETLGRGIKRVFSSAIGIINKSQSNEQITGGMIVGLDTTEGSNEPLNQMQIMLLHQPEVGVAFGSRNWWSFFTGSRNPLYNGIGSITNGGNTLTDTTKNWQTNELAGAILWVDVTGAAEAYYIASNTSTTITISGNWVGASGSYSYFVMRPVFLGAANLPWKRLYVTDDIRFGIGPSYQDSDGNVSNRQWIKVGRGSPENVVAAAQGSLYLRTDGGAGTTLYVKESGTGKIGWVAK